MYNYIQDRNKARIKRALRVRKKIRETATVPRLSVQKTNKHIFVQIIDDQAGITIVGTGTASQHAKENNFGSKSKESAKFIGETIARLAKEKNIDKVVFDRGRYKFHGIIAELVNSARSAGLQI